jgi:hypothetical protein
VAEQGGRHLLVDGDQSGDQQRLVSSLRPQAHDPVTGK